jgi:putative FmdB family regulatory protein
VPTYEYRCREGHEFEVTKRIADIDRPESCQCGAEGERFISRTHVHGSAGDWNRVEYSPALGQWTKSWKEARQIAKARGMEEVGNEKVETVHKHFDKVREEKREKLWKDAERVKLYD